MKRTSTIEQADPRSPWKGYRISEDGDSCTSYAVFPSSLSDDDILSHLDYPSAFYIAPGHSFSHGPHINRGLYRVLVTYRVAQDI